jgi:hypothetical protein
VRIVADGGRFTGVVGGEKGGAFVVGVDIAKNSSLKCEKSVAGLPGKRE